jgi:ubiquinol-cytochrome c reductase iron-sulfur subunit
MSQRPLPGGRAITAAFGLSAAASVLLTVVYARGGQPQIEGVLLGVSLGGIGFAMVLFARRLLPGGHFVGERDVVPRVTADRSEAAADFESGAEEIQRRRLLARTGGLALGALGVAALFPIRSLGAGPGRALFRTNWRRGRRVVDEDGDPLRPDEITVNSVLTVYPEGHVESGDSQALLIRLPPEVALPGPKRWTVGGLVVFSKICTHAGCPVGLYQAETQELFCPCHQSTFSVRQGAAPVFGPATRPLPQLPIGVNDEGFLVALSDFHEPVGPGFWNRSRA